MLTDSTGSVTDRYSFDAYGELLGGNPTNLQPPTTNLLYSGEQFDTGLQQQYLRARYYDSSLGVFGRLDPYTRHETGITSISHDPQSLHRYAYAHSDPISRIDPSGERSLVSVLAAVGIIFFLTTEYANAPDDAEEALNSNSTVNAFLLFLGVTVGGAIAGRVFGALGRGTQFIGGRISSYLGGPVLRAVLTRSSHQALVRIYSAIGHVGFGKPFRSFSALKRYLGRAGPGFQWHHIVEQRAVNVARFGREAIQNTANIIRIPGGYAGALHQRITGLYGSIRFDITGSATLKVRDWLATRSFAEQYKFGIEAIKNIMNGIW